MKKWKKPPGDIIILQNHNINDINHMMHMVPQIRSMTDNFFVILGHFLSFYHTNNPKNQNFEKMKNISGDIIILQRCPKNHDHALYCSWDMTHDMQFLIFNFGLLFVWLVFVLLPLHLPPNSPKNQNICEILPNISQSKGNQTI